MAKAVRMSDIAERLHVSIVTVSKALAGKDGVSEELRQEILQLAEEMGYQSKKFKPAATGKTYTLGIVTSYRYIEKGQSFYWNLYERILFYLAQTGHIGILEVVTDSAEQERQFDGQGNYNFGLTEQSMFHEIDPDSIDHQRGMDITVVTSTKDDKEASALLKHLGFPFKEN